MENTKRDIQCNACRNIQRVTGQGIQCNPCRKSDPNQMTLRTYEATRLMREEGLSVEDAEKIAFAG